MKLSGWDRRTKRKSILERLWPAGPRLEVGRWWVPLTGLINFLINWSLFPEQYCQISVNDNHLKYGVQSGIGSSVCILFEAVGAQSSFMEILECQRQAPTSSNPPPRDCPQHNQGFGLTLDALTGSSSTSLLFQPRDDPTQPPPPLLCHRQSCRIRWGSVITTEEKLWVRDVSTLTPQPHSRERLYRKLK